MVLTIAVPVSGPQYAWGSCSCRMTRKLFGYSRRTSAWRTQGTCSKASRASFRSIVKKLPVRCGATFARRVTALLCSISPSTTMRAIEKAGWRTAHQLTTASMRMATPPNMAVAVTFMSLTSKGAGME